MQQVYDIPIDDSRHETTLHGSMGFPVAVYRTELKKNVLGYVDWHWHDELQWCLVTDGIVTFLVHDQSYQLTSGQALFVNTRCLHLAKSACGTNGTYICIDFLPKLLRFFDGSHLEHEFVSPWLATNGLDAVVIGGNSDFEKEIVQCLLDICKAVDQQNLAFEYEVAVLLVRIWLLMIRHTKIEKHQISRQSKAQTERLLTILNYLNSHLSRPICVADVAVQVHLSDSECCRFFKRMTGDTIFTYVRQARLRKACEELLKSSHSVADIAESSGFGTTSYFIEVFKKHFGMTPLKYRQSTQTSVKTKRKSP